MFLCFVMYHYEYYIVCGPAANGGENGPGDSVGSGSAEEQGSCGPGPQAHAADPVDRGAKIAAPRSRGIFDFPGRAGA